MPTSRADGDCAELLLSRKQARALGFTDARIDTLLRSGRWQAPFRGVLATATGPLSYDDRCRAAVRSQRTTAVLSQASATRLWGLPEVPDRPAIDLTLPRPVTKSQPPGLRLHWPLLLADDITSLRSIPCTTAARSVVDVARDAGRRQWAVVLADAAIHAGLASEQELVAAADRIAHPRHRRAALRAVGLADGRSRSPQESRVRLVLIDGGLPVPVPDYPLYDDWGRLIAVGDLVYDEQLVWLEYDGFEVHSRREAFRADRVRERRIRQRGFDVTRLVDDDLKGPVALVRLVETALADAPARIAALPSTTSPEVARARLALGLPS